MWYVIHTMSGMEQKCLQQCRRYVDEADYKEIFIPLYMTQKHFKKEWHEVTETLFPGYLFVDTENIEAVRKGLGNFQQYTKVLRDGETVSPITKEEQKFLMDMMDENHVVQCSEGFLIGERVCITKGPLRNYQGCIKTVNRHRRIAKLEIPIFGGMTPVEVGFGGIARVSEEEFHQMKQESIQRQKHNLVNKSGTIKVLKGVFEGMTGTFLYADEEQDEWTAELEIFGVETKVVFHREEIAFES